MSDKQGLSILLILIISLAVFVFQDYLFLNHLYLFKDIGSDTINVFYPQLIHISDYLRSDGVPKWSFNQGMGQNIFPFSLGNPFNWILYLLGRNYLAYGIVYVELLKIVLGGVIFYLYLRTLSLTQYAAITGGILFSFSGFMILGGGWYVFSTEAVYGVLLLFSFEKFFKSHSWVLFPISIALVGASMTFNLYTYGIFLLIYIVFRYVDTNGWNIKDLSVLLLKLTGLGLLGIAMSSAFIFSNVLQIIESPRISGEASYAGSLLSIPIFSFANSHHNITAIMRVFSNDLLGTGSSFRGWTNYLEAPIFYSGLLSLLLVPQVFTFLDRRRKKLYSILAIICIVPIIFPFFRHTFWLFSGDYYRIFSFFVVIAVLFFSLQALSHIDKSFKINLILLLVTLIVLLGALYYPYPSFPKRSPIDPYLRNITTFILLIYAILIYLLGFKKLKFLVQIILLITLCFELAYSSSITVNKRSVITAKEFKQKVGYNDYTTDAVAYLNSIDKSFYRIEKDYFSGPAIHLSFNDAKVQKYRGTPSYHSFNQLYYIKFLDATNVIRGDAEHQTRWVSGLRLRPLLLTLTSVKYLLTKSDENTSFGNTYVSIAKFGDVNVLKNNNYLSLGFAYDRYIQRNEFQKLPNRRKDIALLNAFIIDDSNKLNYFSIYDGSDTSNSYTVSQYNEDIAGKRSDALTITEHNQNVIKGTINLEKKKLLFFSIPYDKGWSAKVDGKEAKLELVNIGFMGLLLDRGEHTVELEFKPRYLVAGTIVSVIALLLYGLFIWKYYSKRKGVA